MNRIGFGRSGLIALLVVVVSVLSVGIGRVSANHDVEHRIAQFWQRVDALQSGDHLSAGDVGSWALNVIERDPRTRITVGDFRASAAGLQAAFDRAGPGPAVAPAPPTVHKIGETVRYADGWRLTVTKVEDSPSSNQYIQPKAGMRFVAVVVKFENGSTKAISPNPFDFKLQDSVGVRRTYEITTRDDRLTSSELAPGAFVVGSVTFSAPIGDTRLQLIYEQYGYKQATFQLY